MRIAITGEHLEAWMQKPPKKRMVISDVSVSGLQAWREPSSMISFRYRYVSPVTKKRQTITIGRWPAVSLNDARIKALELATAVQKGQDPKLESTELASDLTLKQLLSQMVESEGSLFRRTEGKEGLAPRTVSDYQRYLADHYGPLADLPIDYLQRHPHVILNHIAGIRSKGASNTARLVRASMGSAFSWGIQTGLLPVQINPCIAQFRTRKKKSNSKTIKRFLSRDEIKFLLISMENEIVGKVRIAMRKQFLAAAMIRLMLYTGVRPTEAAGAFRDEFDLYAGIWTLPGFRAYQWNDTEHIRRTKNGWTHKIPLTTQAVEQVRQVIETIEFSPWLFPVRRFSGVPKTPHMLPPKAMLNRIFKEAPGDNVSPHALRRTVATQLEDLEFADKNLVSRILNHTPQDVTDRHYLGGLGLDKMRDALQRWANYLDRLKAGKEDKVVDLERARRKAS
jgi:integrase